MENRAFSVVRLKSVDDAERVIEGWATTTSADRQGDIVDSQGAVYNLPLPLLMDHNHLQAVGHVEEARVTKRGIWFRARIAKITEAGAARDLVDQAWTLVRHKLRAAVSIGFRALPDGAEYIQGGGVRYKAWEWLELSLCTVPAQAEALILSAKTLEGPALDAMRRSVAGHTLANSQTTAMDLTRKDLTTIGDRDICKFVSQTEPFSDLVKKINADFRATYEAHRTKSTDGEKLYSFNKSTFDALYGTMRDMWVQKMLDLRANEFLRREVEAKLLDRIKALEDGVVVGCRYAGVFQRPIAYDKGTLCTHAGSLWAALKDVPAGTVPGTDAASWQLAAKTDRAPTPVRAKP